VPGRPVKFQTKAPLSVGYKAVLVHEFARPPKFTLRSRIRNEFSLAQMVPTVKRYTLIPNLIEMLALVCFC